MVEFVGLWLSQMFCMEYAVQPLGLDFASDLIITTYAGAVGTSWLVNPFVLGKYKKFS